MDTELLDSFVAAGKRKKKTYRNPSSQKGWVYPVSACVLALSGATFLSPSVHAQSSNGSNSAQAPGRVWIDARVTGYARKVLASVMRTLDPEDRENVVYVDLNNHVYANKPELLKDLYLAPMATDNSYISPMGQVIAVPHLTDRPALSGSVMPSSTGVASPLVVTPPTDSKNTGPFRRVYSRATTTTGYSWESASISLKGSSNIYTDPAGTDTAEVYEGGWGATAGAVDAGFQYSSTYNDWSAIVQRETPTGTQIWVYPTSRFVADEEDNLKFYVPSDNNVAVAWTATPYPTGTRTQRTMVFAEAAGYGWNASGAGCIMKRMTSIAQQPEDLLTSSSYIKNIRWYNCLIGTSSTSNQAWAATDVGGYQSYPAASPQVSVNYVSPAEETDSIDLTL